MRRQLSTTTDGFDQVPHRYQRPKEKIRENGSWQARSSKKRHMHRGALDFNSLAAEGNRFINEVADELGCSRNRAARITRCVLQALRDRLPPNESIEFAQGLPLVLKGVWLDQYDISDTPVVCRTGEEFMDLVESKGGVTTYDDFPTSRHTAFSIRGVFTVLENTVDMGQIEKIRHMLGHETLDLIDSQGRF